MSEIEDPDSMNGTSADEESETLIKLIAGLFEDDPQPLNHGKNKTLMSVITSLKVDNRAEILSELTTDEQRKRIHNEFEQLRVPKNKR